eukprot:682366-Pyramimonas_sp.AAC.1
MRRRRSGSRLRLRQVPRPPAPFLIRRRLGGCSAAWRFKRLGEHETENSEGKLTRIEKVLMQYTGIECDTISNCNKDRSGNLECIADDEDDSTKTGFLV